MSENFPRQPPQTPPDHRRGFLPSRVVRNYYLGTRHSTSPGLFDIHGLERDAILFLVVVVLEIWGLWLLVHGYWDLNGIQSFADPGAWLPYAIAGAAFAVDLLAAIFHHWPYKERMNRYENEQLFPRARRMTEGDNRVRVFDDLSWKRYLHRKYKIDLFRPISWFCIVIIAGLAFLKIAAIQLYLPSTVSSTLKLPIVITYIICAALHVYVTGYFLAGLVAKWGFPPFLPLFQQKGEIQEKNRHLSYATQQYTAPFITEQADFRPFECLMDGETPFEIVPDQIVEEANLKEKDSAFHALTVVAQDLPMNLPTILQKYQLQDNVLKTPLSDIQLNTGQWKEFLRDLDAIPVALQDIGPADVQKALGHAGNAPLHSLIDRRYVFSTYGLLRDKHIIQFRSNQPDSAKSAVSRWAHYAQYQQLRI